ncbi:MAG: radical SAM protein, partial [Candidatus Aenigmatarchaeota archaeon]
MGKSKPKNVFMWFEPRCNLRCEHCNIWKNKKNVELDVEDKKKIIRKLVDSLGTKFTLNFLGGELFLYDGIFEILEY